VADTTELVTAPGSRTGPGAGRVSRRPARLPKPLQAVVRLAGILPFAAYIILGLFIPLIAVLIGAFQNSTTGAWTFSNVNLAVHGAYLKGFENSLELSLIASILPGIFGLLIAYAIFTAKRGKVLRQMVITASACSPTSAGCRWRSCSSPR
jgi:ABC-type uncharacterized transport system permease subunit